MLDKNDINKSFRIIWLNLIKKFLFWDIYGISSFKREKIFDLEQFETKYKRIETFWKMNELSICNDKSYRAMSLVSSKRMKQY